MSDKWQRPSYDSRAHGSNDKRSSAPPDDKTLDPRCSLPFQLIRPNYTKGPLLFRPVPGRDYDNPNNLTGGRESAAQRHYSHFMFPVPAAKYFGGDDRDKYTILLHQPGDEASRRNEPYTNFYWSCFRAHKEGVFAGGRSWDARWNQLMVGSAGKGASITRPTTLNFMQGFVYANGDVEHIGNGREHALGEAPGEAMCVIQLPASANSLFNIFDTPADSFDGNPDVDYNAPYLYGDPVGTFDPDTRTVAGGYFVCAFNPKVTKLQARIAVNPKSPWLSMSWSGTIDPKKPTGYEFAISRVLGVGGQKFKPSLSTEQVERVVKSSFFWTPSGVNAGILHFPSNEEKCVIIAQAFRSIPKLVEWAWFDRSEYMTADVRKILGNAKSSVPAAEEAPRPKKAAMVNTMEFEDDDDFSPPVSKKPVAPVRPVNNQTFTDDDDDDLPVLKKVAAAPVVDDDDEDDAVVPTPIRPPVLDDDEDDAELSVPTKAAPVDEDDLEEGEADDADEFEEDGDDDDDMPPPPKSARNAPPKSPAPKPPRKK